MHNSNFNLDMGDDGGGEFHRSSSARLRSVHVVTEQYQQSNLPVRFTGTFYGLKILPIKVTGPFCG